MMLLAIDPSVISLGYAVFDADESSYIEYPQAPGFHTSSLVCFGTVKKKTGTFPLEERIGAIIGGLERELQKTPDVPALPFLGRRDVVIIEKPQLWGAYKSVASAQSGALLSLHILVGALFWHFNKRLFETHLIPVSTWKGQLPKEVTKKRMEAKYKVKFATDDESDAVGLGTYYIEEVLRKEQNK